jgi:hypothetical protein
MRSAHLTPLEGAAKVIQDTDLEGIAPALRTSVLRCLCVGSVVQPAWLADGSVAPTIRGGCGRLVACPRRSRVRPHRRARHESRCWPRSWRRRRRASGLELRAPLAALSTSRSVLEAAAADLRQPATWAARDRNVGRELLARTADSTLMLMGGPSPADERAAGLVQWFTNQAVANNERLTVYVGTGDMRPWSGSTTTISTTLR